MDIIESLKYGWKKLVETWWWITLASSYMPIGSALYFIVWLTVSRWANNPNILDMLNYNTLCSFPKSPANLKSFVSYVITALVMFLIIYLFAGYIPSKRATNERHNRVMLQTALMLFVLNVTFALVTSLISALSLKHPQLYYFSILFSKYFSQTSNSFFGVIAFVLIAITSYIYEKFTMKNALHLVVIYFITVTLEFVFLRPIVLRIIISTFNTDAVIPLIVIIMSYAYFVFTTTVTFISVETVLQNSLGKGMKKGLRLLVLRSSILLVYLLVWIIAFVFPFVIEPFVNIILFLVHTPSFLFLSVMLATVLTAMLLGEAYLVFITFKLARIFESKEIEKEVQGSSEPADGLNLDGKAIEE